MKFNRFVWELYKNSEQGQKAIARCSRFSDVLSDASFLYGLFGMSLDNNMPAKDASVTDERTARDIEALKNYAAKFDIKSPEQALKAYEKLVKEGLPIPAQDESDETITLTPEEMADGVHEISIALHLAHPEYFLPYGFRTNFDMLQRISEIFSLALPPVPGKRNKLGRALYYAQINQSFHEFRQVYGLDVIEMCAFLHDFAPRFVQDEEGELPAPSKVWPVIGGAYDADDFEWLDAAREDSISHWNGHIGMRRGDVLLMYNVTPHKRTHSVWRAITDGFVDPFVHYHSLVWIGHPIKTAPVTFKEMKAHELLSQTAIVKTHMLGPSSGPFALEEYDAILELMASKGQDISLLPRPQTIPLLPSIELDDERDVEVHLVEPLLERLGYSPGDWVRQMPIRMGRGERNYPDYAFGATQKRGEESAWMILEAKFRISGEKELQEAYYQAKSYALRLQAKRMVIAAREGVWVYPLHRGGFSLDHCHFYDWQGLGHPDALHRLAGQIGKGKLA